MPEITISDLGSLGEFVGAIAVIASLIYVGAQIKQNTKAVRISTTQSHLEVWNDVVSNFCQSQELASIYSRGISDISILDEAEKVQFFAQLGLIFRYYESSYLQREIHALDDRLWEGLHETLKDTLFYPGARQWWYVRRHWFYKDFRAVVDEVAARGGGQAMYGEEYNS